MKYLLTIILFMSVNVFADFSITNLDCELGKTKEPRFFTSKLSLRIDEKRKMMRLNLLPEDSYTIVLELLYRSSFYYIINHTIELSIDSLILSYETYRKDNVFRKAIYNCKII